MFMPLRRWTARTVRPLTAGFAAATLLRFPDLPDIQLLDLLSHFPLQAAVVGACLTALALLVGDRRAAVAALALAAVNANAAWPQQGLAPFASASAEAGGGALRCGPPLRLGSYNILEINGTPAALLDHLANGGEDLVFVFEVAPWMVPPLRAPIREQGWLEFHEWPAQVSMGTALLSRIPLRRVDRIVPDGSLMPYLRVELEWGGRDWILYGVHPENPIRHYRFVARNSYLRALAARIAGEAPGARVVAMGDFNTTPYASIFREFLDESGLADPGERFGRFATWRDGGPLDLGLPIDHALHSASVRPTLYRAGPTLGSDHVLLKSDFVAVEDCPPQT